MRGDRDISEAAEAKSIDTPAANVVKAWKNCNRNQHFCEQQCPSAWYVGNTLFIHQHIICLFALGSVQYVRIDGEMCKISY